MEKVMKVVIEESESIGMEDEWKKGTGKYALSIRY